MATHRTLVFEGGNLQIDLKTGDGSFDFPEFDEPVKIDASEIKEISKFLETVILEMEKTRVLKEIHG